jgi:hypothetical protein
MHLKLCDDGILTEILYFWTLPIVLILSKTLSHLYLKHNVSETGFCIHFQAKPTQLGPVDRASPYFQTPLPTPDRVYKPSTAMMTYILIVLYCKA